EEEEEEEESMSGDDDDDYIPQGLPQSTRSLPASKVASSPKKRSPRSRATSSSQKSETGSEKTRKPYTLKKDHEREGEKYKELRRKNNESVKRTRKNKKAEAKREKDRSEKEKNDLKEMVKKCMKYVGEGSTHLVEMFSQSQKELLYDLMKTSSRVNSHLPGSSRRH
ncbi:hypothetical protein PMAYCL1PPCAC_26066, partial [Pristionchus mayeri]